MPASQLVPAPLYPALPAAAAVAVAVTVTPTVIAITVTVAAAVAIAAAVVTAVTGGVATGWLTLAKTIGAIDRPIAAWLEWNPRLAPAGLAGGAEHLAWRAVRAGVAATTALALAAACQAAGGAAARLVRKPLRCVELLLARGEGELRTAVAAGQNLIAVGHPMTPVNLSGEADALEARGWSPSSSARGGSRPSPRPSPDNRNARRAGV